MQHVSAINSTQTLNKIIHFYFYQIWFLFLKISARLIVYSNLLIVILEFHLSLIDILINVDLVTIIFDINVSARGFLRVKATAHLFGKYLLINLHNTFISTPSTLIVSFYFLIYWLVVSGVILLNMLFNNINISFINLKILRNWLFYWVL